VKDRKRQPGRWTSWMQNMTGRLQVRGWVYLLAFILIDFLSVGILQWGVSLNSSRVELSNPLIGFWGFISAMSSP